MMLFTSQNLIDWLYNNNSRDQAIRQYFNYRKYRYFDQSESTGFILYNIHTCSGARSHCKSNIYLFILFIHIFTYTLISRDILIPWFCWAYFQVSRDVLFSPSTFVLSLSMDAVLTLSIDLSSTSTMLPAPNSSNPHKIRTLQQHTFYCRYCWASHYLNPRWYLYVISRRSSFIWSHTSNCEHITTKAFRKWMHFKSNLFMFTVEDILLTLVISMRKIATILLQTELFLLT